MTAARPAVVIRVDASAEIGPSRLLRCLTLATDLRARGADVTFVCRRLPGNLIDFIDSQGFDVSALPYDDTPGRVRVRESRGLGASCEADIEQTLSALTGRRFDWLVVDHAALDAWWEERARPLAGRLLVIDDLADRPHDADVLVDPNFHRLPGSRYAGLVSDGADVRVGPEYAFLRPEFEIERRRLRPRDGRIERAVVAFGGADDGDGTLLAVRAFMEQGLSTLQLDVVAGAANPRLGQIEDLCRRRTRATLHVQTREVARLYAAADIAVGAPGTSCWERCALGLPSVVIGGTDGLARGASDLAQAGGAWFLRREEATEHVLAERLRALVADPSGVRAVAERAAEVMSAWVDGAVARLILGAA